jgi:hypothetical protein
VEGHQIKVGIEGGGRTLLATGRGRFKFFRPGTNFLVPFPNYVKYVEGRRRRRRVNE